MIVLHDDEKSNVCEYIQLPCSSECWDIQLRLKDETARIYMPDIESLLVCLVRTSMEQVSEIHRFPLHPAGRTLSMNADSIRSKPEENIESVHRDI